MNEACRTLVEWALTESPSHDGAMVNRMMDLALGSVGPMVRVERVSGRDGLGDHLILRTPAAVEGRSGALLVGHLDTVHPPGTAASDLPVRIEGDRLFGPGVYDMKGGIFIGMQAVNRAALSGDKPVTMIITSDEEIGSPTSRDLIEQLAASADYALVFESGRPNGGIVTARKGVGWFDFDVEGRSAHAGTHHADGRNAIVEAARQIVALEALTDYERGTTVSVGTIRGGTGANVVPRCCGFSVDVRVASAEEAERIAGRIQSLRPVTPDTTIAIGGGFNRPPFTRSPGTARLFQALHEEAERLGQSVTELDMTGGGSDANFVAALGVPTLDGLGVLGHGAHTLQEHCLLSSIAPRQQLVDALIAAL